MSDHTIELITLDGKTLSYSCPEDTDLISAAEGVDIYLNAQCHSGSCGACIAHCDSGEYRLEGYSEDALSEAARSQGEVLMCCTRPQSDMRLSLPYEYDLIRFEAPARRNARITTMTRLTPDTVKLELQLEPDEEGALSLDFEPGQFVQLGIPDTDIQRPYSLANTPNWDGSLEFLIKLRHGGVFSTWLDRQAAPGMMLEVEGPFGTFVLRDHGLRPRYFVAGGCGLASIMSMLKRMAEWQEPHTVKLFFGVSTEKDLFYQDEITQLAADYPNLQYQICLTRPSPSWTGYHGSVVEAFKQSLAGAQETPDIYVCGSPHLVEGVTEAAIALGIDPNALIFERYLAGDAQDSRCDIS